MKWKVLSTILGVIAVGAVATTIMVSQGYRITKAPEPQVATAPETIPTTPIPEPQVTEPAVTPTEPTEPASEAKPETKPEPVQAEKPAPPKPEAKPKPVANVATVTKTIPAGTKLAITLETAVSSKDANVGDAVQAKSAEPLVVDGIVLAPEGSAIAGKVREVVRASKNKSEETMARLDMSFHTLATVGGSEKIHGTLLGGEKKAGSTTGRDAAIIVGSGVAGAVLGKVIGKSGKATAAGGVVGAAAGMGVAAMQKGNEVSLPAGTKLTIVLDSPVEVAVKK
jgi:hypothetical protein